MTSPTELVREAIESENDNEVSIAINSLVEKINQFKHLDVINAGIALRDANKKLASEQLFKRILELKPESIAARYELSVQKIHEGNHSYAIRLLKQILEIQPGESRSSLLCARLLFIADDHAQAERILNGIPSQIAHGRPEIFRDLAVNFEFGKYLSQWPRQFTLARLSNIEKSVSYINTSKVYAMIMDAIHSKSGFSLVRVGDGEGAFICNNNNEEADLSHLYHFNRTNRAKIWIGSEAENLNNDYLAQLLSINHVLQSADIIGIPYRDWLQHEFRIASICGISSLTNIVRFEFPGSTHLCTQLIHLDLHNGGLLYSIIRSVRAIGIITCHRNLPSQLAKTFNIEDIEHYFVSGEHGHAHLLPEKCLEGIHYPNQFHAITNNISRPLNGKLFLIAAGILGKFYCHTIKQHGGVALDIGSIADGWQSCHTRPGMKTLNMA